MDNFMLKCLLVLLKLMPIKGIDLSQIKIITSTKLILDRRRTPATWRRTSKKEQSNGMLMAMFLYGLMGLIISFMVFAVPSLMLAMIIIHTYLLFMLIMTMITDFSNVLLDTSDAQIILPKPVSSRTLLVARSIHIVVYMGQLLLAIMIFPIIFSFVKYGVWVGLSMLLTTALTTVIGILLTYILYGMVIRFADEQKVKDIIGYFQIAMTIFFAVGYQIVPRILDLDNISFSFTLHWYSYLLPPVWMAGFLDTIHHQIFDMPHLSMMICAVTVPLLAGLFTNKYLAPQFARFTAATDNSGSSGTKENKGNKESLIDKWAGIFCSSSIEQASFNQVWKITGRDKNFKMQFYPGLAYIPVMIFMIFFRDFNNMTGSMSNLHNGNMFLWLLYLAMFSVALSLSLLSYYENYSASWIYQSSPVSKPGQLISGAIKSLLIKFFVPVYLVLSIITVIIWGPSTIDDIVLAASNNVLIFCLIAIFSKHYLPFSQQPNTKDQAGKFALIMIRMLFITALVGTHWLALRVPWLVVVLIPFSVWGSWLAMKKISSWEWKQIVV